MINFGTCRGDLITAFGLGLVEVRSLVLHAGHRRPGIRHRILLRINIIFRCFLSRPGYIVVDGRLRFGTVSSRKNAERREAHHRQRGHFHHCQSPGDRYSLVKRLYGAREQVRGCECGRTAAMGHFFITSIPG